MPTNHDPCQASAAEPLVLLPVRLETRFETSGKESSLKVRIYPDEVHVDDLARGLTEEEETAGQAYWQAVWFEPPAELAWEQLLKSVGPERAEWVAHALTPTNLAERGSAAPRFPDVARPGPGNVVARGLPDAFVVIAIQDNQVSSKVGEPIEPELPMNPLPLDEEEPKTVAGSLAVPSGSEWLVDYTAAEKVGMAVTVPLAGGRAPVQRVLALGARGSSSPAAGAGELEDLLRGHRFGAGLELLAQGTPTNNADGARSPYRSRREPQPPLPAAPSTSEDSDAAATAAALGIDPTFLAGLVGDGSGEQLIAQQVNTALWGPGWGSYLDQLKDRKVFGLDDHQVESARRLFGNHVRGRGPAATIRVGAQPYGVLPVSDLSAWKPQVGETTAGIVEVVKLLLPRWLRAADLNVPLIRTGDPEVDKTALEVLGSSPVMLGLRVRPVVNKEKAELAPVIGVSSDPFEAERDLIATAYSTLLGEDSRKAMIGSLDAPNRPLPLPLVSARDPEFIAGLLREPSEELAIDSVLQALLALAWKETDYSAARAAPATVVPDLIDLVELDPRLKEVTVALSARAGEAGAEELHGVVSELQDVGIEVGGPSRLLDFQPAAIIPTSLGEVALASPSTDKSRLLAGEALSWWLREMAYKAEVREAMEALLHTDLEARKLAVAEALDCSSHRLDAWATAIVAERRALQLSGKGDGAAARGLTLGAYGVVEDLVPDDEDSDGSRLDEWIQAPSPGHAVAAGILRSAHLSHLPTDEKGGPFAIDLSSVRVQAATHLLEGVRQGQQLGAIVGYQIERGLAEIGQARLQLSLRTIAPLVARRLSDADGADPTATREAVAANNVVDGVLLLELHPPGDEALRSKLKDPPQNSYLGKDDWLPLDDKQWEEVTKVMEAAAEALDTVADVMLSESVMQFANGNAQRAAAAMDAMSTGASPDESVDVLDTREASERLDHRLLVVVGSDPPASGWNENRPRALAEPRLESWAATRLGDPAEIVVAELAGGERFTLDEAGMAALDLVFAADRARLERALRIAIPGLGGAELASQRDSSWPQGQRALGQVLTLAAGLRGLVAGATPLLPLDLARSSEEAAREMGPALPELTARVTDLVGSFTQATKKLRETVAALPKDGIVEDAGEVAVPTHAAYDLDRFGTRLSPIPHTSLTSPGCASPRRRRPRAGRSRKRASSTSSSSPRTRGQTWCSRPPRKWPQRCSERDSPSCRSFIRSRTPRRRNRRCATPSWRHWSSRLSRRRRRASCAASSAITPPFAARHRGSRSRCSSATRSACLDGWRWYRSAAGTRTATRRRERSTGWRDRCRPKGRGRRNRSPTWCSTGSGRSRPKEILPGW